MNNIREKIATIFPEEKDIPHEFMKKMPVEQNAYLINGELCLWSGPMQDVFSPVFVKTAEGLFPRLLGRYPLLTEKESFEALDAAARAYDNGKGLWPAMSVEKRIRHVEEFSRLMKERKTEVVHALMWEIGKSLVDAEKEFDRTISYIQDTIYALKDLDRLSARFSVQQGILAQIRRVPLGVVLCMGPYNYPLNENFTTLIPALIMGNTVIFKPPRPGTLLYYPLLEAFQKAFPPGVLNILYGEGPKIIPPLMASGRIDLLAFIGSSSVATILKKQHPRPHRLRSVLGLDAKNAAIILPDADLDLAVKECILGTLLFNGQRCTALKILFVHSEIQDAFFGKFLKEIDTLKTGMPWERDVQITPLPELSKVRYHTELVEDALRYGAHVINEAGGTVNQTFYYPAVIFPVTNKMRLYREEQFGPVIPILTFSDREEPVRYIIDSNYGLQTSIFSRDPAVIAKLIDLLVNQVCRVNINSQCQRGPDTFPFTGRKDSAEGTLSVSDALRAFSIRTLVAFKETETNKEILSTIVRERLSNFLSTDFIL